MDPLIALLMMVITGGRENGRRRELREFLVNPKQQVISREE